MSGRGEFSRVEIVTCHLNQSSTTLTRGVSNSINDLIGHVGETVTWTVDRLIEPLASIGADYSGPCGNHFYVLGIGTGAYWV